MEPLSGNIFSRYDRQVWILVGGSLINSFGFSIAYPFISLYLFMYRGIPMTDVGMALLIASLVGLAGQFVSGEICDRVGRKVVMNIGLAMNTITFALLTGAILLNQSYAVFVVLMCLREISGGLYRNIPNVMVTDVVDPGDRNGAFSLLRIGANLGFALGPILGGVLAFYSYAIMFGVTMVTSFVYLLISLFLLHDTKPDHCVPSKLSKNGKVWSDHPFLLYCLVTALISIVYSQMLTTFSTYSGSYGHIDELMIGLLFSLNGFMVVFLQYPIAVFLERFKLTTALIFGTLIYAVGLRHGRLLQRHLAAFRCHVRHIRGRAGLLAAVHEHRGTHGQPGEPGPLHELLRRHRQHRLRGGAVHRRLPDGRLCQSDRDDVAVLRGAGDRVRVRVPDAAVPGQCGDRQVRRRGPGVPAAAPLNSGALGPWRPWRSLKTVHCVYWYALPFH